METNKMINNIEQKNQKDMQSTDSCLEVGAPVGFEAISPVIRHAHENIQIDQDKEIWLFRLPHSLNASDLNGKTLDMDHLKHSETVFSTSDGKKYILTYEDNHNIAQNSDVLVCFPSKNSKNKYKITKSISKVFTVCESVDNYIRKKRKKKTTTSPIKKKKKNL